MLYRPDVSGRVVSGVSAVACAALLAACGAERGGPTTAGEAARGAVTATAASAGYDGVTLYRGLLFGDGAVGASVPELFEGQTAASYGTTDEERQAVEWIKREMARRISAADPTFFSRFAGDVQSGSHLRVAAALDEAGKLTDEALQAMNAESEAAFRAQSTTADAEATVALSTDASQSNTIGTLEPTSGSQVFAGDSSFIRGDTVFVHNGDAFTAVGLGTFFNTYKFINRVLALNRVVAVNRFVFLNRALAVNVNRVYNRTKYWGRRVEIVNADPGAAEFHREYVVNLVATRLSATQPVEAEPATAVDASAEAAS